MGNKLTLNDVANLQNESSVVTILAQNNRAIEAAVENTLSRDGSDPNYMQDNLDMNSKRLLNLPAPILDTEPVRLVDVVGGVSIEATFPPGGSTGQALVKASNADSDVAWATVAGSTAFTFPQGRVTLATGTPVMSASQAGATTVYYTPAVGAMVPIYDGSTMTPTVFTELSQATTDTTKSPSAVGASKIYDLFVWKDATTTRCTRGPAWTNSTTRGYTLTMNNGILLNTSDITNGPAAQRGTWVGTIASNASSTIDYIFGTSGDGGVPSRLMVWNAYNRVNVGTNVLDTTPFTSTSATVQQFHNGGTGMQIEFVLGAQIDTISWNVATEVVLAAASGAFTIIGAGLDTITAFSGQRARLQNTAAVTLPSILGTSGIWNASIGTHKIAMMQRSDDSANSNQFNNSGASTLAASIWL